MPNGICVKQYRPSGPIKVVRSADSSSNSIVWRASETSTMVNTLAFFNRGTFSSIVGMVYTGLRIALFIVWLGSIHILIELGHWNATSGSMDWCNSRIHFYVQRVSKGLPIPWFEDIHVVLKDVLFSD